MSDQFPPMEQQWTDESWERATFRLDPPSRPKLEPTPTREQAAATVAELVALQRAVAS